MEPSDKDNPGASRKTRQSAKRSLGIMQAALGTDDDSEPEDGPSVKRGRSSQQKDLSFIIEEDQDDELPAPADFLNNSADLEDNQVTKGKSIAQSEAAKKKAAPAEPASDESDNDRESSLVSYTYCHLTYLFDA